MDFTHNPQEFRDYLETVNCGWTLASKGFMGLVDRWQTITADFFPNLVEIGLGEKENVINGKVLGKSFLIELYPLEKAQVGYAEAVLSTDEPGYAKVELSRFHICGDGALTTPKGAVLVGPQADRHSYEIYTVILRAVLEAPAAARDRNRSLS